MYKFRIDKDALHNEAHSLIYFEDAGAENSQYHKSRRDIESAQQEVQTAINRLNGAVTQFIPVIFENPERVGYIVEYVFRGGAFGQLPIAALPIRQETPRRRERARVQALLIAADMFHAAANAQQHTPLNNPLLLHLLADGEHTIAQMIAERQELPEKFLLKGGD
jgi:hypothetical protein